MVAALPRTERLALLDREDDRELSIVVQAALFGLNRSGLYYEPVPPTDAEIRLRHRIDEIFTAHPFFGSRRVAAMLAREGFVANRKHVMRCMREMGLVAIHPRGTRTARSRENRIHPYLLRDIRPSAPDHIWGTDITYVRLRHGWMYLVAFMDWFSRYVVAWELDQTLEAPFVLDALRRGLATGRRPVILNSDQGSHFTSDAYLSLALGADITISMDGRGRCMDNIFTERLWRSYKYEEVYINEYASPRECRQGAMRYFEFYNNVRPHQALGNRTPAEVYFSHVSR